MKVSRNTPVLDRQRKVSPEQWTKPGLAMISYAGDTSATCSCGWSKTHPRVKALEDAIDRHVAKRHNGRAIRL